MKLVDKMSINFIPQLVLADSEIKLGRWFGAKFRLRGPV
jgi:hypothetical protein